MTILASAIAGCRVNPDDLKRWESTERGPEKLAAVMTHDKYDKSLRIEAAWSLVEMKKRAGQPVGTVKLIEVLAAPEMKDRRDEILDGLWKRLEPKVRMPLETSGAGWKDPSAVFKDATTSLLIAATETPPKLTIDPKLLDAMRAALTDWAVGKDGDKVEERFRNFEVRMDNSGQQYGVEQVIRRLGLTAVKRLPALLEAPNAIKSTRLDAIGRLITDSKPASGDLAEWQKVNEDMANKLVKLFQATVAGDYIKAVAEEITTELKKTPDGQAVLANPQQTAKYYDDIRKERLTYLFTTMKAIGGRPIVAPLLKFADDDTQNPESRAFAVIATDAAIDTTNDTDMKQLITIARGKAPNEVKSAVIARMKRYPAPEAIKAFYSLFESDNWKVRYTAAMAIVELIDANKLTPEKAGTSAKDFLEKLPAKSETKMGLGEFHTYAKALASLPEAWKGKEALTDAMNSPKFGARMTALGYYVMLGKPEDVAGLGKVSGDKEKVPACTADDACGWDDGCSVPKAGGKPDETELKSVTTVGEYVTYCVIPQIELRKKNAGAK